MKIRKATKHDLRACAAISHIPELSSLYKMSDQEAIVFVKAATSSSSALLSSIKENWVIWVIILANIVLIAAIIIAAVRLSKRE